MFDILSTPKVLTCHKSLPGLAQKKQSEPHTGPVCLSSEPVVVRVSRSTFGSNFISELAWATGSAAILDSFLRLNVSVCMDEGVS